MPNDFSRLICAAPAVRSAFEGEGAAALWWRVVLALHGKPRDLDMSAAQAAACAADGFHFYATLYGVLAGVFAASGAAALVTGVPAYVGAALLTGGAFLAASARLASSGAAALRRGDERAGTVRLVTFLVGVVGFLCALCGGLSVAGEAFGVLPPLVNVALNGALLLFGVGSYLIEVVYLVTR